MKVLSYRIILRKEPEGAYTVIVPSLPGCITYGDTIEEAIESKVREQGFETLGRTELERRRSEIEIKKKDQLKN